MSSSPSWLSSPSAPLLHTDNARPFDWSWLGFSHFDGASGFASGALIAAFYYWGWDVTSNLSEETKDSRGPRASRA